MWNSTMGSLSGELFKEVILVEVAFKMRLNEDMLQMKQKSAQKLKQMPVSGWGQGAIKNEHTQMLKYWRGADRLDGNKSKYPDLKQGSHISRGMIIQGS